MKWTKVVTHMAPDFDALASAYIVLREEGGDVEDLVLRSVYDPIEPGAVYVDMTPGNGATAVPSDVLVLDHHVVDTDKSATEIVWAHYGHKPKYKGLVIESRITDRLDNVRLGITMGNVLGFVLRESKCEATLIRWAFALFDSVCSLRQLSVTSLDVAAHEVGYVWAGENNEHKIAYYSGPVVQNMNTALFKDRGVSFIVYENPPWSLGVIKSDKVNMDLRGLAPWIADRVGQPEAREWFYHPNGFLACRGTTKSPAPGPSQLSLGELLDVVSSFLGTMSAVKNGARKGDKK
jgi:hypothetical protein